MEKKKAIKIITEFSQAYKNNLLNKNVLIIYKKKHGISYIETLFLPRNYLHLTGVQTRLMAVDFYDVCTRGELKARDIWYDELGTTPKKLSILPSIMNITKNAKMFGDYDDSIHYELYTEKITGTITACLGFIYEEETGYYVPNTALKEDIRDITVKQQKVLLVLIKKNTEEKYKKITYRGKKVVYEKLNMPREIKEKIDI